MLIWVIIVFRQGEQEAEATPNESENPESPAAQERDYGIERNEDWSIVHIPRISTIDGKLTFRRSRRGKDETSSREYRPLSLLFLHWKMIASFSDRRKDVRRSRFV